MKTINDRFLEAMQFVSITGYTIHKAIGISEATITNIRKGKTKPSTDLIEWLLHNYEVISAEYIMRGLGSVERKPAMEQRIDSMIMELGEMKQTLVKKS